MMKYVGLHRLLNTCDGSKVIGELYLIKNKHLEALDHLEGEGVLYKRQQVEVFSVKDDTLYRETEVMTYVYLGDVKGKRKVEGKWYIQQNI